MFKILCNLYRYLHNIWFLVFTDNITLLLETAMGYNLDTQLNNESEFAEALTK